ncbi:ATP-binding protein [Ekhidna sp.]
MCHRLLISLIALGLFTSVWSNEFTQTKEDTLDLYWFTSKPFIYENEAGVLEGIEFEILTTFQEFLQLEKEKSVHLNWIKAKSFPNILSVIKTTDNPNVLGVSALSITDKRKEYAAFTVPYLPDITVLVSSKGTPIVRSFDEMNAMMSEMDAVTIRETKYEALLQNLKRQLNVDFDIIYIESERNVIEGVEEADNRFGFIDLPVYLLLIERGGDVTRQNFFTIKGQGYSFIMPLENRWKEYFDEFLSSEKFSEKISSIISSYMGEELYAFIDEVYAGDQIGTSILTKEKELQLALIKNANLKLEEEQAFRKVLTIAISVTSIFLIAIGYLFYNNQRTTKLILGQNSQIEEQQEDIRQKNEQLMNRNAQLVALNEEKNNLVKILAHDIRSPLSQIIMIADIINQKMADSIEESDQKLLGQVTASAERINQMVTKILDVDGLEETRIKVLQERVNITVIMRDVAQRYRPIAAKKGVELTVELCENHNMVRTDHLLLLLVLENLISNAVKFSDANTTVELKSECAYDSVLFKVSDEGPGFSEEDKKKLFNRFQKLSAKPTAGEASTGLGLSIVKKYVQDLGGKVWVESEEGKGSTFFVKLSV